ncbi:MAG TPA: Uma2 family endonuclease [Candidatus Elarobacter sp.]|jgi:Uma2 family endonuclease|nr:Uma2 family endonuclease [Candidatus Elarobacter sp.]
MSLHEIVLPETKPETEWVRGRALQKEGGTYTHATLQSSLAIAVATWSDRGLHGRVGMEWRFRVAPPGKIVRPLVPDVAFLAFAKLAADAPPDDVQVPLGAPSVAIEVLAAEDCGADVADKIATYLAAGTEAVLVVDPRESSITVHDRSGARVVRAGEILAHSSMPDFTLDVGALFARLER